MIIHRPELFIKKFTFKERGKTHKQIKQITLIANY